MKKAFYLLLAFIAFASGAVVALNWYFGKPAGWTVWALAVCACLEGGFQALDKFFEIKEQKRQAGGHENG